MANPIPDVKRKDTDALAEAIDRWSRHLRREVDAGWKSPRTRESYIESANLLRAWLLAQGRPLDPAQITSEDLRTYFYEYLATKPHKRKIGRSDLGTVRVRYASLAPFFKWLLTESSIATNPLQAVERPRPTIQPARILPPQEVKALYDTCRDGRRIRRDLPSLRDYAILKMFTNTGMRLRELAGIYVEEVDLDHHCVSVLGKGNKPRLVPLNDEAEDALVEYLYARRQFLSKAKTSVRRDAEELLWIGPRGRYSAESIQTMIRRRARLAKLSNVHAHLFRSYFAHHAVQQLGEDATMTIAGWTRPDMLRLYVGASRYERAAAAIRKLAL